jgi:hypothetical protein
MPFAGRIIVGSLDESVCGTNGRPACARGLIDPETEYATQATGSTGAERYGIEGLPLLSPSWGVRQP